MKKHIVVLVVLCAMSLVKANTKKPIKPSYVKKFEALKANLEKLPEDTSEHIEYKYIEYEVILQKIREKLEKYEKQYKEKFDADVKRLKILKFKKSIVGKKKRALEIEETQKRINRYINKVEFLKEIKKQISALRERLYERLIFKKVDLESLRKKLIERFDEIKRQKILSEVMKESGITEDYVTTLKV